MEQQSRGSERREFGRRPCAVRGMATVSGHAPIACTLRDVSEGGALISFTETPPPGRCVRITIDGSQFQAVCEVRHTRGLDMGVRFTRRSDGDTICRLIQASVMTRPVSAAACPIVPVAIEAAVLAAPVVPRADILELRRDMVDYAKLVFASSLIGCRLRRSTRLARCAELIQAAVLATALRGTAAKPLSDRCKAAGPSYQGDWRAA